MSLSRFVDRLAHLKEYNCIWNAFLAHHTFLQLDDETQGKAYFTLLLIMGELGLDPPGPTDRSAAQRLSAVFGVELPKRQETTNLAAWAFMSLSLQRLGVAPNLGRHPVPKWKAMGAARDVVLACKNPPEEIGQMIIDDLQRKHGITLQDVSATTL